MDAKVLYVDDEPDIREIAGMSLELASGFEVRTAESGPAALAIAQEWRPDLILLDVMMPEMDGPMTLERLSGDADTSGIPVVFVTARSQASEIERFEAMGVLGVIPKPFDPMTLAGEAQALLEKHRQG